MEEEIYDEAALRDFYSFFRQKMCMKPRSKGAWRTGYGVLGHSECSGLGDANTTSDYCLM
jgi:hypothetical protein